MACSDFWRGACLAEKDRVTWWMLPADTGGTRPISSNKHEKLVYLVIGSLLLFLSSHTLFSRGWS